MDQRLQCGHRAEAEGRRYAVEVDQQQSQGGEALLTIDEETLGSAFCDDDGSEEVLSIVCCVRGSVALAVVVEERGQQVRDQLLNVAALPLVLALVLIDRERSPLQQLADAMWFSLPRWLPLPVRK